MAYKALYRTYRPQTFNEIAGQQTIVKTIDNALSSGKLAHAYLFSGPRGTGKTTMAKLLAKALNCEEGVGKQCNKCDNCLAINDGSHPDVYEIDAASNSGVDNIRDLIENVKYSPIKGRYKVYIIDEVHMMSTSAFNALLKTLEEPPSNVVFILATTEPHKVLSTILSRVQRFDFSKVSDHDLKGRLLEILKSEQVDYEESAVDLLISLADGGVRDALSMLDQVLAFSINKLRMKDVEQLFGLLGVKEKLELIKAINEGDVASLLTTFDKFAEGGIDLKRLNADLLDILKEGLIFKATMNEDLLKVLSAQEARELLDILSISKIETMIEILMDTQNRFKNVANVRSLFEISLLKIALIGHESLIEETKDNPVKKPLPKPSKAAVERDTQLLSEPLQRPPLSEEKQAPQETSQKEPLPISDTPQLPPQFTTSPPKKEEATPKQEPPKQEPLSISGPLFTDIKATPLAGEGEEIYADEEMLINLMCLGDRDERKKLLSDWPQLNELLLNDELSSYGALLLTGTPYVLTDDVLVLNYMSEAKSHVNNIYENQRVIQTIVEKLVGRKVIVLGVYDKDRSIAQKKFMDLSQIGRLPRLKDIVIQIEGADKL